LCLISLGFNAKYELLQEFIGEHPDAMTIRRALD